MDLEDAKRLLRDAGYVVIPRDRHVVLTCEKDISIGLLENMRPEDVTSFQEYVSGTVARSLGCEMLDAGAITKTELGDVPFPGAISWRYRAAVILPRKPEDHR